MTDFNINLDFQDVEAVKSGQFPTAPEGDYTMTFEDGKIAMAKNGSGNTVAGCTYSIAEGEHFGKKVFHNQVLAGPGFNWEQSKGYMKAWLEAISGEELNEISLSNEWMAEQVGNTFDAHIKLVADNRDPSKMKNELGWFL